MMEILILEKTKEPLPFFPVGTKFRTVYGMEFLDGSKHNIGDIVMVNQENSSYFSCCHELYEKID